MKQWFSVILSLVVICALPSWANTGVNANVQELLDKEATYYTQAALLRFREVV